MKLENEILYVEMVEHGAELTRIYNKKTGAEILWNADPKFWKRHSPVLFPNVGKTWHNVVKIQGEQYPTSQHGFARDHDFNMYSCRERRGEIFAHVQQRRRKKFIRLILNYTLAIVLRKM